MIFRIWGYYSSNFAYAWLLKGLRVFVAYSEVYADLYIKLEHVPQKMWMCDKVCLEVRETNWTELV